MGNQSLTTGLKTHFRMDTAQPAAPGTTDDGSPFVHLYGNDYYKISNSHLMAPFFMSLVSSGDQWMFVASNGALTAGRVNPDSALFPYYSSDKLIDLRATTGPVTIIQEGTGEHRVNWRPFGPQRSTDVSQNLYKSLCGSSVIFEETNHTLDLQFRYRWQTGIEVGFVRTCELINLRSQSRQLRLIDGLQNLVPADLTSDFQLRFSNLADAYKRCEKIDGSPLALYYLNSIPTDRAEPSEGLRTTVCWQTGLPDARILLSTDRLEEFLAGEKIDSPAQTRGQRGCYLTATQLDLVDSASWSIVADVSYDHCQVIQLLDNLQRPDLADWLAANIKQNQQMLRRMVSSADGNQASAVRSCAARHQANVTFNIMRGGLPVDGYHIPIEDLLEHLLATNRNVHQRWQDELERLPSRVENRTLIAWAQRQGDADLTRLVREYLPLWFSRRHGDPTRPWNLFSINTRKADGERRIDYQGNWRDIFQNWEALGFSFPQFLPSMLLRFVNASTIDGYNPYRLSKHGFDWEKPESGSAWSNLGYWGDHQIIYQLKFIEHARQFLPDQLDSLLNEPNCVFANVPYRIASYDQMLRDSRNTIHYDQQLENSIQQRVDQLGTDGKLCFRDGELIRVSLLEKLLLSGLTKLANLIPDAGIWLNTQRPEWNDANNALVGIGASVVTTCYLRRFFAELADWLEDLPGPFQLSPELSKLLEALVAILEAPELQHCHLPPEWRRPIVDQLQLAAESYRQQVYASGVSSPSIEYSSQQLVGWLRGFVAVLDSTIIGNQREDRLFHSYNLVRFESRSIVVERLEEMLEGQVAVLSSGTLSAESALAIVQQLSKSNLYREDQSSYLLYPNRDLPRFLDKNIVPSEAIDSIELLRVLVENNGTIIRQDVAGNCRFDGRFRNSDDLRKSLNHLAIERPNLRPMVDRDVDAACRLFETTFGHQRFTGRSGSFFGYEGLGSIYWHMVSKLAVAVQEVLLRNQDQCRRSTADALLAAYREIQNGLGVRKTPSHYGAFPTDPYSHTPENGGARQPGMTGQVKEDILTRLTELGVRIQSGQLSFDPRMIRGDEVLTEPQIVSFDLVDGSRLPVKLAPGELAFTFCQVPVVYHFGNTERMVVDRADGSSLEIEGNSLTEELSAEVFSRSGVVRQIRIQSPSFPQPAEQVQPEQAVSRSASTIPT